MHLMSCLQWNEQILFLLGDFCMWSFVIHVMSIHYSKNVISFRTVTTADFYSNSFKFMPLCYTLLPLTGVPADMR